MKDLLYKNNILVRIFFCLFSASMICATLFSFDTITNPTYKPYFMFNTIIIVGFFFLVSIFLKRVDLEDKINERLVLCFIIGIGLTARIMMMWILKTEPISDFSTPHSFYQHYLEKGGYQWGEPLDFYQKYYARFPAWLPYMLIVKGIYSIFGYNPEFIKIFNLIIWVVSVLILYKGVQYILSKKIAVLSILIFALTPTLWTYTGITTPDHITIMLFCCVIWSWGKMLQHRYDNVRKSFKYIFITTLFCALVNWFKPLSIYLLIVFICFEVATVIWPNLKSHEQIKLTLKENAKFYVVFFVIFVGVAQVGNVMVNTATKYMMKTDVVNSTPFYIFVGYSVDKNGNYSTIESGQIFNELQAKYGDDQEQLMKEVSVLAKQQIKDNMKLLPSIFLQKYQLAVNSEYGCWGFSNTSSIEGYSDSLKQTIYIPFMGAVTTYMFYIYLMITIVSISQIFSKQYDKSIMIISLMIFGYLMVLVLGGVQGRYKYIIFPQFVVVAAYGIEILEKMIMNIKYALVKDK